MNGEEAESETDEEIPVETAEPNPFWKQNAEKLVGESISSVEDSAKQFIAITGLLQGIYFHAITFSDIREEVTYSVLIYVAPLLLWLLSLIFAMLVLFRKKYSININSSRNSKETFERIATEKYRFIRISGVFLILSFVALIIAVLHYLGVVTYQTFIDLRAVF
ncbi:hypothetical protein [Methanosarcina mazei]|uniref:Uncharacterized protein n=1 Tax=Methanosarcina mazei TaxID=2209 RepID=A0A0F8LRC3_METMZ|nr:hypothetical protein [Methanosarcina mazei]KKG01774.1 hypothetical protein DU31_17955 [Methanosarcina mazei]KKG55213.1 hypothetical protein DU33_14395 [Methanosarcina mazei]KKG57126.1 hypothetical protein DU64_00505 [Methanosarcina mazei]KKG58614.1 hypothetical protein DU45_01780 [Methanosarcina mazei]KKG78115.1 hypothetical protein DU55_00055 [Methanosarcina mazei]